MLLEVQSALVGAFVTIAVTTGLLLRRRRRRTDILFSIFAVILVLWFLAAFLRGTYGGDPWLRVEMAIAALLPAALVRLFFDMVPGHLARGRRLGATVYPLSTLVAVAAISPLGNLFAVQVATATYIAAAVFYAARAMTETTDVAKGTVEYARRRYLAIGAVVVTIACIAGGIPRLSGTWAAAGHLALMLYVFFLSQAILRERLIDLNEFLSRMVILSILAVLFASLFTVLVSLGSNISSRLFNAVIGVIILLTLYEPLKTRLEGKAVQLFFRERHRFALTLEELRRRMLHVIEPSKMSVILMDTLYDTRRATHAAVYLLEPLGNGFELHASRGPEPAPRVDAVSAPKLWLTIQQTRGPILTEQLSRDQEAGQEETANQEVIAELRSVSADVLLPFVSGETVHGFLALRDDRSPEPYSTAEIADLMKVADTAATVIWNSKLADRLRERERLAAVGAMAAGLAHEIRNPLGAIKGAAEYLDPEGLDNEEESEFLQVIIDETNRLNSVVSQFLDYARPFRPALQPTDINDVIRKTAKLVEAHGGNEEQKVNLDLGDGLPTIQADGEQIKQVILNLILNGIDATKDRPAPITVTTRFLPSRDCVEIRVRDRGPGIPREDLDSIFIPFFTTKQQGTGLGLAVCQRIITNHGGTIYPESRDREGTEFVVQLPVSRKQFASTTGSFSRPRRRGALSSPPKSGEDSTGASSSES